MNSASVAGIRCLRGALLISLVLCFSASFTARADDKAPPLSSASSPSGQAPGVGASSADGSAPSKSTPPKPERKFEISEIDVEGNTVLDDRAIESAVYPFVGPDKTMADIEGARAALEKTYQSSGFQTVYVTVPPQTVRNGVVMLRAVEAKIGQVTLKGQDHSDPQEITDALPSLTPGTVPNVKNLNQELVQLNTASNDRQVTPQMKQGKAPDTIDVDLAVQDQLPVHGSLEVNNKYSPSTAPLRLQAGLSYDDLWDMGHSLSGLYSVAPQNRNDGEVYALTYSAPIPSSDIKLSLTGLMSDSNVNTLGSTDVIGKGHSITLAGTFPFAQLPNYYHYLQASFAYKDFSDTVSVTGQSNASPITYYPVSVGYVGSYQDSKNQASINTSLNFAFRGLGSNQTLFDNSRYLADGDFFYIKGAASYLRNLPYGFDVYTEIDGQLSNRPLVSNEEFAIGGDGSVRGYLQSEGLGDQGWRGSIELRAPNLAPSIGKPLDDFRFIGFFDAAGAFLHDPLPGQQQEFDMRSMGVGFTTELFGHLFGSLSYADPLVKTSSFTKNGKSRLQFRVYTQF